MTEGFNPAEHIMQFKGRDYLEVKWRQVWLNEDAPRYEHESEVIGFDEDAALVRATVRVIDENGILLRSAQGLGRCTRIEFNDFVEKAETAAIGRALNMLGYGTQFADPDLASDGTGKAADAPVGRAAPAAARPAAARPQGSQGASSGQTAQRQAQPAAAAGGGAPLTVPEFITGWKNLGRTIPDLCARLGLDEATKRKIEGWLAEHPGMTLVKVLADEKARMQDEAAASPYAS